MVPQRDRDDGGRGLPAGIGTAGPVAFGSGRRDHLPLAHRRLAAGDRLRLRRRCAAPWRSRRAQRGLSFAIRSGARQGELVRSGRKPAALTGNGTIFRPVPLVAAPTISHLRKQFTKR